MRFWPTLTHPTVLQHCTVMLFTHYYIFFSFCPQPSDPQFSSQIMVYKDIGEEMLQHAFDGNYHFQKTTFTAMEITADSNCDLNFANNQQTFVSLPFLRQLNTFFNSIP